MRNSAHAHVFLSMQLDIVYLILFMGQMLSVLSVYIQKYKEN